jgi:hypothetical protein
VVVVGARGDSPGADVQVSFTWNVRKIYSMSSFRHSSRRCLTPRLQYLKRCVLAKHRTSTQREAYCA